MIFEALFGYFTSIGIGCASDSNKGDNIVDKVAHQKRISRIQPLLVKWHEYKEGLIESIPFEILMKCTFDYLTEFVFNEEWKKSYFKEQGDVVDLYKRINKREDSVLVNDLGVMYHNGIGVEKNYEFALYWYKKAADLGVPVAYQNLAKLYEYGLIGEPNFELAYSNYLKAAELGEYEAYSDLGGLFIEGKLCPIDMKKAFKYFSKGAEHDVPMSLYELGKFLWKRKL